MPDRLLGLNEGPADVVVADEAHLERESRVLGIADRGTNAGVRDRNDNVRLDGRFDRQMLTEVGPHLVDAAAEDVAVRPGEVDMLEDAVRERCLGEWVDRAQPTVADDQDLAGFHVPHVRRTNQVERTGF